MEVGDIDLKDKVVAVTGGGSGKLVVSVPLSAS
jgi:hypothetical protein